MIHKQNTQYQSEADRILILGSINALQVWYLQATKTVDDDILRALRNKSKVNSRVEAATK